MAMRATTATYHQYEKLLFQAIYKSMKKWGGTFDDYLSDANDIFMYACGRYKKKKGNKFSTYLVFLLNCLMVERIRKELKYNSRLPCQPLHDGHTAINQRIFEIPDQLSEDAKVVVELVLDMPADIKLALVQMAKLPEDYEQEIKQGRSIAKCLKEFLSDLKWSAGRIDQAFNEIRTSL